jgi:hypothetical protein
MIRKRDGIGLLQSALRLFPSLYIPCRIMPIRAHPDIVNQPPNIFLMFLVYTLEPVDIRHFVAVAFPRLVALAGCMWS